uniref:Uncharacterized protein n=1 Tax=Arundo donax TaxID=35708 RepID=A0A0A9F6G2_ARUDO
MQLPRITTSRCTMMTCHYGDSLVNWTRIGSKGMQNTCCLSTSTLTSCTAATVS